MIRSRVGTKIARPIEDPASRLCQRTWGAFRRFWCNHEMDQSGLSQNPKSALTSSLTPHKVCRHPRGSGPLDTQADAHPPTAALVGRPCGENRGFFYALLQGGRFLASPKTSRLLLQYWVFVSMKGQCHSNFVASFFCLTKTFQSFRVQDVKRNEPTSKPPEFTLR